MNGVARPVVRSAAPGAVPGAVPGAPPRRVRHEVRDGLVLMAFSAVTSIGLSAAFLLLAGLGK